MAGHAADDAALADALNAYIDGELGPDEAAALEARLADDPDAADRLDAYARHRDLLRDGAELLDPGAAPPETAALEAELAHRLARRARGQPAHPAWAWPRNAAVAAVLLATGWFGHAYLAAPTGAVPGYVSEALGAHRVFAEDYIRPAEFAPETSAEALAWLSTKLGHAVRIPSLNDLGMTLVGTRLHGTKEGPLLQVIYENERGERLSLTMARHPKNAPIRAFDTLALADQSVGYWTRGTVDYAVVAEKDDPALQAVAGELAGGRRD